ncbi:MAG: hypothetical protein HYU67_03630 [Flavobacteriia bacterium]|nr:hypothetical protein [Flavobacteriia bacterium]
MNINNQINSFSPYLFWDVDPIKLDLIKNKEQIINKVLEFGLMKDWILLQQLYSEDIIRKVVVNLRNLDKVTLSFVSHIYKIPKSDFRCYQNNQSAQNFWNS